MLAVDRGRALPVADRQRYVVERHRRNDPIVARYRFLTTWVLEAPRDEIFQALHDVERWPSWWRGVETALELEPGRAGADGEGSRFSLTWKSRLPYRLEFRMRVTSVERPLSMEGVAEGELAGIGRWRLFEEGDQTAVLYEWDVQTTGRWINLLAPLMRPIFAWNHDVVMRQGGEGLARLLKARLVTRA